MISIYNWRLKTDLHRYMAHVNKWQHKKLIAFKISLSQLTGQIKELLEHFVTQAIFDSFCPIGENYSKFCLISLYKIVTKIFDIPWNLAWPFSWNFCKILLNYYIWYETYGMSHTVCLGFKDLFLYLCAEDWFMIN